MKKIVFFFLFIIFIISSNKNFSKNCIEKLPGSITNTTSNPDDLNDEGTLVASVVISQTSGTNPMCAGASATFTAIPTNGGGAPGYQWKVDGADVGPNSATYTTTSLTTGQVVTCVMTSSLGGVTGSPATSNSITVTVNPIPSIPVASNTGAYCAGTTISLNTPGISGASYNWTGPGSFISALQNPTLLSATTAMAGTYSVTITISGCTSSAGTTNVVVHSIPATPVPKINGSTAPASICAGGTITLTTPSVSGATYSWSGPGGYSASVRNPPALTSATTAMGGTYSLTVTVSGCTSSAGIVSIVVNPIPATPTIASNSPICVGSAINLTTSSVTGATYAWTGPASFSSALQNPTRSTATLTMTGTYSLTVTVAGCTSAAGSSPVSVNSSLTPAVSVSASPAGAVCTGTSVTFTAIPTNGGTTPGYQWQVNGSNVGTDSPVFSSSTLASGQIVTCVMTSSSPCAAPLTATSSGITMAINPVVIPTIDISIGLGSNPMCIGQSATFIAATTHGGGAPVYQWQINGANAGTSLATFTSFTLNDGDIITCILTSNAACASPATITSPSITMVVNPMVVPATGISIDSGVNPMCAGQTITFIANDTNGGLTPIHQWQINSLNVGSDSPIFSPSVLNDSDLVTCILTSDATCISAAVDTSNGIIMMVNPIVVPAVTVSIDSGANPMCAGESITFSVTDTNAGTSPEYQWQINGLDTGSDLSTFTSSSLNDEDTITCILTSDAVCATPASVISSPIFMIVNPTPVIPTITQADTVLTSSSATGNQWYLNGVLIPGATDQNYSFTENGIYTVIATEGSCSSPVSDPAIITNVGIQETENSYLFSIYPNPNDGRFTVSFNSLVKTDYQLELVNLLGQSLYKEELTGFSGTYFKQLNVADYGRGIYLISLMNNKSKIMKKVTVY